MAAPISAAGPAPGWRFVTPANLLFALLMFPLPWIEVKCNVPAEFMDMMKRGQPPAAGRDAKDREMETFVMISQSGLEAATGKLSEGRDVRQLRALAEQREGKKDGKADGKLKANIFQELEEQIEPAPLVSAYGIVLLVTLLLGLVLPLGSGRSLLLLVGVGAAITLLAMQTSEGLPLERKLDILKGKDLKVDGDKPEDKMARELLKVMPHVVFTPFYYLAWGLTGCAALLVLIEWMFTMGGGRRPIVYSYDLESGLPPLEYEVRSDRDIQTYDDPRWRNR